MVEYSAVYTATLRVVTVTALCDEQEGYGHVSDVVITVCLTRVICMFTVVWYAGLH